jgi:hypothetical protein
MKTGARQLKILVDAQLASLFKTSCRESGVSMAKELSEYMERLLGKADERIQVRPFRLTTRKNRRSAIRNIVSMLAAIRDAEEAYFWNIPENLRSGPAYENAESAVSIMEEAIALLNEVYD